MNVYRHTKEARLTGSPGISPYMVRSNRYALVTPPRDLDKSSQYYRPHLVY